MYGALTSYMGIGYKSDMRIHSPTPANIFPATNDTILA